MLIPVADACTDTFIFFSVHRKWSYCFYFGYIQWIIDMNKSGTCKPTVLVTCYFLLAVNRVKDVFRKSFLPNFTKMDWVNACYLFLNIPMVVNGNFHSMMMISNLMVMRIWSDVHTFFFFDFFFFFFDFFLFFFDFFFFFVDFYFYTSRSAINFMRTYPDTHPLLVVLLVLLWILFLVTSEGQR